MKYTHIVLFVIFWISLNKGFGQIVNGDFTTWSPDSLGALAPDGWVTSNHLLSAPNVFQDADRSGGAGYSVKFVSVYDSVNSEYVAGFIDLLHAPFSGAARPSVLSGYWKLNDPNGGNIIAIEVNLYNAADSGVGHGTLYTPFAGGTLPWTAFNLPLTYTNNDPITSYSIESFVYNFTDDSTVYGNLDDLTFDVPTEINSFSNVSTDAKVVMLGKNNFLIKTSVAGFHLNVFDMQGRPIKEFLLPGISNEINLSDCQSGLYVLRITNGKNQYAYKVELIN